MQKLLDVMFDDQPKDVTVWPTMVDVVTSKEYVNTAQEGEDESWKWKCTVERYSTAEYAAKVAEEGGGGDEYSRAAKILLGLEV